MSNLPISLGTVSDVIPADINVPPIDYTSRDYMSLVNDMVNLIPSFLPEWTDRSPGDFGIVMLELFAYVGDILNFYSDRIANEAFIATAQQRQSVLNIAQLLDYTPHNNVAATATLTFQIANPSPTPVKIPAHTQVSTLLTPVSVTLTSTSTAPLTGFQNIIFETIQDLWVFGDGGNNAQGIPINGGQINGVGNGNPGQNFLLGDPTKGWPTYVFLGSVNQTVTVAGTTFTYAPGNSFIGQAAAATMYTITNGNTVTFGGGTTANPGAVPASGAAIVINYQPAAAGNYAATVQALQGQSDLGEGIGISDGTPNQQYNLFNSPVVDGSVTVYVDEGNGPQAWTYYPRIVDAFASDTAYTLSTNANGVVTVIFGDGIAGQIPAPGAFITADYMIGGGSVGNVAANSLTQMMSPTINVVSVTNAAAASGGADIESTDHIRIHAPLSISAINRAVSLDDYAALTLNVATIAKASAMSTAYNAVNIYIHPAGDFFATGPTDSVGLAALQTAVTNLLPTITNSSYTGYLDNKKMVQVSIQVLAPQYNNLGILSTGYVPCNVSVTVQVLPQYHNQDIQSAVQAAIQNLFLFAVVDFGSRISLSSIYHACMNTEGVDYVNVTVMARNEANQTLAPADIVCAPYEIPRAYQINVTANGGILY